MEYDNEDDEDKKSQGQDVRWADWEKRYGKKNLEKRAEDLGKGVRNDDNPVDRFVNKVREWFRKK
jgi:hypothetical protein